jgi:tryptophan synthase alpha chain
MNRIDMAFSKLKAQKRKAFIPYLTAGDPDMRSTRELVLALVRAGADIVELGIPFSDPLADGPTIQRAVERSLASGASARRIFAMVSGLRKRTQVPIVFMTYYNIVYSRGIEKFMADARKSGADGIIVADMPREEAQEMKKAADRQDIALILLTAPTTPARRFSKIAAMSRGFVYYVSLTGVTGARGSLDRKLSREVSVFKKLTSKPVCVGFGVSTPRQARDVARYADGVIVGSALINVLEKNMKNRKKMVGELERFARSIARAVHSARCA